MNANKEAKRQKEKYSQITCGIGESNLSNEEQLVLCVLEYAVLDYKRYLEAKARGLKIPREKEKLGLSARAFLETKRANYYGDFPMDVNLRIWVEEKVRQKNNIDKKYEDERKEYKRKKHAVY